MGYFSEEDLKKREANNNVSMKKEVTKDSLINAICLMDHTKKREALEKLSMEKLKQMKNKLDLLQQKAYFSRYGTSKRERLYEYEDDLEEKDGFSRS